MFGCMLMLTLQVIRRLCASKETMSLKNVCTHLSRKPSSLDVLLLFEKPATILRPVCDLLDTWHYEEDQGEYQPVYEEFGSILMLVMSFTRRYDLTSTDLGLETPDSFIARFLARGDQSQANETLTAKEQGHLDGWIRGLFDNESSGLGDELMSSCPPQNFYLLVPTLFNNIVLACHTNHLTDEALKGGLEFLVDIFLLPSLVSAISWLSSHLRELRGDANSVLIILGFLITKPPTGLNHSSEASQLLTLILNIVSRPLEHSLRFLQRNDPVRQDIEPLLRALKGSVNFERHGAAGLAELERWSKTEGGGITTSVKLTMASLVQWTLNPGMNIMPASYSHRQILTALKMVGARRVLLSIINEVKSQTESGHGSVGLDIAVAIICAPNVTNFVEDQKLFSVSTAHSLHLLDSVSSNTRASARRLTLREALKLEAESVHKILPGDPAQAETIVRLWRRVEAQMAPPPPMQIDMTLQTSGLMNNTVDEAAVLHSALDVTGPLAAALTVDVGAGLVGMNDGLTEELMTGLMSATSAAAGTTDLLLGDLGF